MFSNAHAYSGARGVRASPTRLRHESPHVPSLDILSSHAAPSRSFSNTVSGRGPGGGVSGLHHYAGRSPAAGAVSLSVLSDDADMMGPPSHESVAPLPTPLVDMRGPEQEAAVHIDDSSGDASSATATLGNLRQENRNLRMRLMYMDEILAKRNLSHTLVQELADAKQQLQLHRTELSEALKHLERNKVELIRLRQEVEALTAREATWKSELQRLEAIPALQQRERELELERDEAVTKLLSLQVETATTVHALEARAKAAEEEGDRLRQSLAHLTEQKSEQLSALRVENDAAVQQIVEQFETVKRDLRALLEQRSEALSTAQRELQLRSGAAAALASEVESLKRALAERDAALDTVQQSNGEVLLRQRRTEMDAQDACFDRDRRITALETALAEQRQHALAAEDDLQTHKLAVSYAIGQLQNAVALATTGASQPATVSHPWSSLPPSPVRGSGSTTANGAAGVGNVIVAASIKASIDDAVARSLRDAYDSRRVTEDQISRMFRDLSSWMEHCHSRDVAKIRTTGARLADSCDFAELCVRRRRSERVRRAERAAEAEEQRVRAQEQLAAAHEKLRSVAADNEMLIEELRRVTSDREAERAALDFTSNVGAWTDAIRQSLRQCAADLSASVVHPTSVTPEFLQSVQNLVRQSHRAVEHIHDAIQVAQRQYHQYLMTQGGADVPRSSSPPGMASMRLLPSPISLLDGQHYHHSSASARGDIRTPSASPHNAMTPPSPATLGVGKYAGTVEGLIAQLANVCALLQNNATQTHDSALKVAEALQEWESRLTKVWSDIETNVLQGVAPLAKRQAPRRAASGANYSHTVGVVEERARASVAATPTDAHFVVHRTQR